MKKDIITKTVSEKDKKDDEIPLDQFYLESDKRIVIDDPFSDERLKDTQEHIERLKKKLWGSSLTNRKPNQVEEIFIRHLFSALKEPEKLQEMLLEATPEVMSAFIENVNLLKDAYTAQKQKISELEHTIILKEEKHSAKMKNATSESVKKANNYALSINDQFQELKNQIQESETPYTLAEMARRLTENKIAPPRGNPGDKWSINAVNRHEERIQKLSTQNQKPSPK